MQSQQELEVPGRISETYCQFSPTKASHSGQEAMPTMPALEASYSMPVKPGLQKLMTSTGSFEQTIQWFAGSALQN